jgi:hypothetical protein
VVHPTSIIEDRKLCVCVLILVGVNLSSRAHYIGTGGGAHCPLIEGIIPDQSMRGGLNPL